MHYVPGLVGFVDHVVAEVLGLRRHRDWIRRIRGRGESVESVVLVGRDISSCIGIGNLVAVGVILRAGGPAQRSRGLRQIAESIVLVSGCGSRATAAVNGGGGHGGSFSMNFFGGGGG